MKITAEEYLKRPYTRTVVPDIGGTFASEIIEFPGCFATGDTAIEALKNIEEVAIDWINAALENGQEIPEPFYIDNDCSGKINLHLPKTLHKKIAWAAEFEGVDVNQYILSIISASVGE